MENDTSNQDKIVQLNVDIPKGVKRDFENKIKAKGLKKKHVVERLLKMWTSGEINID